MRDSELVRILNDLVVACYKILSQHPTEEIAEVYEYS
jgi:hypothetical protein